jgi:hypothetical protein
MDALDANGANAMAEAGSGSGPIAQVCPVCSVKILKMIGGDRVIFSAGSPGTRAILWQRVCRHAQKSGCINLEGGNPPRL